MSVIGRNLPSQYNARTICLSIVLGESDCLLPPRVVRLTCRSILAVVALLTTITITTAQEEATKEVPATERTQIQDFVPPVSIASVTLFPKQYTTYKFLSDLPWEIISASSKENFGADVLTIERMDLLFGMPGMQGPQFGALLHFADEVDAESIQADGAPVPLIAAQVDANRIVFGTENYVKNMLENAQPDAKLAKLFAATKGTMDAIVFIDVESLRPLLVNFLENAPPQPREFLTPIFEELDELAVKLDIGNGQTLNVVGTAKDEAAAHRLSEGIKALIQSVGEEMVNEANRGLRTGSATEKAMVAYAERMRDTYSQRLEPKMEGNRVKIVLNDLPAVSGTAVMAGLLLPGIQAARFAARGAAQRMESANNLKNIILALLNFESAYKRIPAAAGLDAEDKPLLSWRVAILPFIEEQALFSKFHMDEPWDSEHNIQLLAEMPEVFRHPTRNLEPGYTVYQAVVGEHAYMKLTDPTRLALITDGMSNTIAVVEVDDNHAVPWTAPMDYNLDEVEQMGKGLFVNGIINFALADGSVHALPQDIIDEEQLEAMLTSDGGEVVDISEIYSE